MIAKQLANISEDINNYLPEEEITFGSEQKNLQQVSLK